MANRLGFDLLAGLVITVCGLAYFAPVLSQINEVIVGSPLDDTLNMFYPLRDFANGEIQQGRLPLWNPYILCGHPLHAEGQAALFHPLNLLLAPLSAGLSLNLFALLNFLGAGLCFYLYLRICALRRDSALFGALIYMFSSGPISRLFAGHYTIMPFAALVPAFLCWIEWRKRGDRPREMALAGLIVGVMCLSGYPQMLVYSLIYLAWIFAMTAIRDGARVRALLAFVLVVGFGAALGAIQLLPTYAFSHESFRQQSTFDFVGSFSFAPENLVTVLVPRFFGSLRETPLPYWGRNYLWEMWIYIGVFPLALALMAAVAVRSRLVVVHGWAVVLFLVLALGRHTPVLRLLYEALPLFGYFRGSSKFIYFVLVSLCTLSAAGLDNLLNPPDEHSARTARARIRVILAAELLILVGGFVVLMPAGPTGGAFLKRVIEWRFAQGESLMPQYTRALPVVGAVWTGLSVELAWAAVVAAAGFAAVWGCSGGDKRSSWFRYTIVALAIVPDLGSFATDSLIVSPVVRPPPSLLAELPVGLTVPRMLAPGAGGNMFVLVRMPSTHGYVGTLTRRFNQYLTTTGGLPRSISMANTPVKRLDSWTLWPHVGYILLDDTVRVPERVARTIARDGGVILLQVNAPTPRAYFSRRTELNHTPAEVLDIMEKKRAQGPAGDLIEAPSLSPALFGPPVAGDNVYVEQNTTAAVVIRTHAAGARLLVLTDSYYPEWSCTLDGVAPLPIYPANIAFRAVLVPPGDHTLVFQFEAQSFWMGGWISEVATVILVLLVGLPFRHSSKP